MANEMRSSVQQIDGCHRNGFSHEGEGEVEEEDQENVSLVAAIGRKYGSDQRGVVPAESTIFLKASDQLPGKRGASGSLELLVLDEKQINVAGDLSQLSLMVHNITELDLTKNKLLSWREVYLILSHMPLLVHANLSHNPLSGPLQKDDGWQAAIDKGHLMVKLNSLVLNATGVRWDVLCTLLDLTPHLEELHLSLNDYSHLSDEIVSLSTTPRSFPNIHCLHINHCQLKGWRALMSVCRPFPCLETLIAAGNQIPSIVNEDGHCCEDELREYFGCLHTLNANRWHLNSWQDLDAIRKFPLLCELRINNLPIFQGLNEDNRRKLSVARLPDITSLNGSQVTPEQREDAERYFLRHYSTIDDKPHRYFELENIHGRLMPLAEVDLSPKNSAEVLLVVGEKRERRRVGLNQSVAELKKALQEFCEMPPGRFRLFFLHAASPDGMIGSAEELKWSKIMLHSLHVEDGDEFHIVAKPEPPARRRTSSSNSATAPACANICSPKR